MMYCETYKVYYWGSNKKHHKCKTEYLGYYSPSMNCDIQSPVIKHFYISTKMINFL